jgi:hypothetical protein
MRGQGDDPSQHDVPRGPEPVDIGTHRTGSTGTFEMSGSLDPEAQAKADASPAPNRSPFASSDRAGAYVFLSKGELNALNDLFNDLTTIDRVFGTDQTRSPAWRLAFQIQVINALLLIEE